jgi:2-succinyl-6-hydroxy-2,4-cyclohexadiene-1-carboxylate synthase
MIQNKSFQFHYQTNGNPKNPPILFLHGFLGSGNDWRDVIRFFSPKYYCLIVDLPGHGKTGVDECGDHSFEGTAQALIKFISRFKFEKCFLVGYSMGGRLALFLTLRYPQFFSKTILESASPGLRTRREREQRISQDDRISEELETEDFHSFLRGWYSQPIFEGLMASKNFDGLLTSRLRNNPKMLAQSLRFLGTGAQPTLWEELRQNRIPILLLVGENDIKFKSIAREMANSNRSVHTETIEGCSHNIHFQKPEQFARHIIDFFNEN